MLTRESAHAATSVWTVGDDIGSVRVQLFAAARDAAGTSELRVGAGSIDSIRAEMIEQHPALARVLPACSFLVDGLQPSATGELAQVPAGAVLDVLPPFAGG